MSVWPQAVQKIGAFFVASGAEARVEELGEDCGSAADAAEALGCGLAQIVKSLVVMGDGRPALALVSGPARADLKRIAAELSCKHARIARPAEVTEATGFEPGAVTPFLGGRISRVLLDDALLRHDLVWCGAGSRLHMAALSPQELLRLTQARAAAITES
ncbi:MAG: aminoacyl-tRNA deacylase [Gaiella sp.]